MTDVEAINRSLRLARAGGQLEARMKIVADLEALKEASVVPAQTALLLALASRYRNHVHIPEEP